jgi:hypothetical protein
MEEIIETILTSLISKCINTLVGRIMCEIVKLLKRRQPFQIFKKWGKRDE